MQYLRLTARPPLESVPPTLRLLVASEHVERTRWVAWNRTDSRGVTVLLHVVGDRAAVADHVEDAPAVVAADVAPAEPGAFHLLATLDPTQSAVTAGLVAAVDRDGLVVLPPVADRNGVVEVRFVGHEGAVGAVVEALPDDLTVDVRAVGGRGPLTDDGVGALSDRQREAVRAALDRGYYDQPRRATQDDVADALDCAPSTASDHLRKAEAKLVRRAMDPDRQ